MKIWDEHCLEETKSILFCDFSKPKSRPYNKYARREKGRKGALLPSNWTYSNWALPYLRDAGPACWVNCFSTVYVQVQCQEPKTRQQKVQFYCEDKIHYRSGYSLSMVGTLRLRNGVKSYVTHNSWELVYIFGLMQVEKYVLTFLQSRKNCISQQMSENCSLKYLKRVLRYLVQSFYTCFSHVYFTNSFIYLTIIFIYLYHSLILRVSRLLSLPLLL